jgi:hypothetical protein
MILHSISNEVIDMGRQRKKIPSLEGDEKVT